MHDEVRAPSFDQSEQVARPVDSARSEQVTAGKVSR
jgi:hypothetical protein